MGTTRNVLGSRSPGGTDGNHKKRVRIAGLQVEILPETLQIRIRSDNHSFRTSDMCTRGNKNWPPFICQWPVRRYSCYHNFAIYFHHDIIDFSPPHVFRTK
jgi:hypothetical protein